MPENERTQDSLDRLLAEVRSQATEAINVIRAKPGDQSGYVIDIPEEFHIDSAKEDIDTLVAKTSNAFGRLNRLTGILYSLWKASEAQYDQAFAKALATAEGSSDKIRHANAQVATEELARKVAAYEGYYRILERYARAAEVASESARKIASKVDRMWKSEQ